MCDLKSAHSTQNLKNMLSVTVQGLTQKSKTKNISSLYRMAYNRNNR